MTPILDITALKNALDQGDWKIECRPQGDRPPTSVRIVRYSFYPNLVLLLDLPADSLRVRICDIFGISNQFGGAFGETRHFKIRIFDNSQLSREQRETFVQEVDFSAPGLVFVRDKDAPPGWPDGEHVQTYGMEQHRIRHGNGEDLLRTPTLAQPRTLRVGDVLATGDRVLSPLRRGYNSSVLFVHLGDDRGSAWVSVAARLPIALRPR